MANSWVTGGNLYTSHEINFYCVVAIIFCLVCLYFNCDTSLCVNSLFPNCLESPDKYVEEI